MYEIHATIYDTMTHHDVILPYMSRIWQTHTTHMTHMCLIYDLFAPIYDTYMTNIYESYMSHICNPPIYKAYMNRAKNLNRTLFACTIPILN